MELQNELPALLLERKMLLFLSVYGALPVSEALFKPSDFLLHNFILVGLLLDLRLQRLEVAGYLCSEPCALLKLSLQLLVPLAQIRSF